MSRRRPSLAPWSSRPIGAILAAARGEAELARHGYVGLEHLLISLTLPEAPETARLLAEHGLTTQRTRDAVWLVVGSGRGDGPRFDPATLLGTLGIDLDQIRRHIEAQFGPNAIHTLYASPVGWHLRPRGPLCDLGPSPQLRQTVDKRRVERGAPRRELRCAETTGAQAQQARPARPLHATSASSIRRQGDQRMNTVHKIEVFKRKDGNWRWRAVAKNASRRHRPH